MPIEDFEIDWLSENFVAGKANLLKELRCRVDLSDKLCDETVKILCRRTVASGGILLNFSLMWGD